MKKIVFGLSIILIILVSNLVNANTDFLVKKTSSGDETYTSNLTEVGINSSLTFELSSIGGNATKNFGVYFPAGFSYNNYNIDGTCGVNITSNTNTVFSYSFSGSDNCISILTFSYNGPNIAGNYDVNLIENSSIMETVNIGITSNNTITTALSKDENNNGYIDSYLLYFQNAIGNTSISGLKVGAENVLSYSGNTFSGKISFPDNIFSSGDLPQITSTGVIFGNIGILSNNSVSEEDSAIPILLKINSQNISNGNLTISDNGIIFEFSEKLLQSSTGGFILKKDGNNVNGIFTLNNEKLTFTPVNVLTAGNYTFSSDSTVKDWSQNGNILNLPIVTLIVNDNIAPIGLSLGKGNGIIINNGESKTNNRYVQLNIGASDNIGVSQMIISNDSSFSSSSWENYDTNKYNWLFSSGNSIKNVYIKFKDNSGNESSIYTASIEYAQENSYLNFENVENIYINALTISISGACNNVDDFGNIVSNTINYSVNGEGNGTFSCSSSKSWNHIFNIFANKSNDIKIWYGTNYNSATIKNNITIINPVPTCASVLNGTVSGNYPECELTCNNSFNKVGNSCISTSTGSVSNNSGGSGGDGGGGGGGGSGANYYFCNDSQLECKFYLNNYIWQRKNGIICIGGNLGKNCNISSNDISTSSGKVEIINNEILFDGQKILEETKKDLLNEINKPFHKTINKLALMINYEYTNYFVLVDKDFKSNYEKLLFNYESLFKNLNSYYTSKDKKILLKAKENYINFNKYYKLTNNLQYNYIVKKSKKGDEIYETKDEKIKYSLSKIEKTIIGKYKNLLLKSKISKEKYNEILKNYNSFVLYFSIYKIDNSKIAKKYAKDYLYKIIKNN